MTEPILRFYVYYKKSIRGPFFAKDAALQPGFNASTLVCPEKQLGQWKEAGLEPAFQSLIAVPPSAPVKPKPPMTVQSVEEAASRSLLEKAISKNANLERDVKDLRKSYHAEKASFEEALRKKDLEVKALADKLRRSIENSQNIRGEHPSWETLYKTLKKRSEDKLSEATQAVSEKTSEVIRLKEALAAGAERARTDLARSAQEQAALVSGLQAEIQELKSQLEEKDMIARTFSDNIASLAGKNEEFQRIMLDERHDAEVRDAKFCEEIGALRAELKWRDGELAKMKEQLFDAMNRLKEFEAVDEIKSREQEELYGVLSAKLKLLSGYFENLESKMKFAFRKA